jgi:NADH:ubiquinone oxidoreductase subunit K
MSTEILTQFWQLGIFVILLFVMGLYCLCMTFNLIRALIGVELLIKAATLLIIAVGYVSDHKALTQSLVITLIVVEVVFITVATGVVMGLHKHNDSLDVRKTRNLRG